MNPLLLSLGLSLSSVPAVDPPPPFASLRAGISAPVPAPNPAGPMILFQEHKPDRVRNAIIGAVIGGAAGIVTCTVISNIVKDPGTGFSTCTESGYLLLGLSGAGLGALIGALVH